MKRPTSTPSVLGINRTTDASISLLRGNQPVFSIAKERLTRNKLTEGILLGNLGDSLLHLKRMDEAQQVLRQAIVICEESLPLATGAFRGSLACLLAQQDQFDEAQGMLNMGEPMVKPRADEHAKFLARKSQVQCLAGNAAGARESLAAARSIAEELHLTDGGEVAQTILASEDMLDAGSRQK